MTKKYISFPANISCFPRRLENVFSVTLFVFQDVLKTFWRRIQDVFAIRLPKMPSRRLQDVFARRIAIMSSRRLGRQKNVTLKTSWRLLEDVFSTSSPRRMFAGKVQNLFYHLYSIFNKVLIKAHSKTTDTNLSVKTEGRKKIYSQS